MLSLHTHLSTKRKHEFWQPQPIEKKRIINRWKEPTERNIKWDYSQK